MITNRKILTASSFASMFFLGIGITVVGAAARNIGLSPARVGYLITAQNLGFTVSVIVSGALADRFSKTRILTAGSVILALSFLTFYAVETLWVNMLIMATIGIGIGTYEGASDAMLLDIHSRRESLFVSLNHSSVSAGSLAITAYLLYLQASWRRSVVQVAIIVGVLALVYALSRIEGERRSGNSLHVVLTTLARRRVIVVLFIAEMCVIGVGGGTIGLLTSYLMELRNYTQVTSKIGLIVFLAGLAIGRVISGFFTKKNRIVPLAVVFFALSSVGLAVLYFARFSQVLTYPIIALTGLSIAPLLPMMISLAGLIYRDTAGTAMGVVKVALPLGGIVVPFLLSVVTDTISFEVSLIVFPAVATIGLIVFASSARAISGSLARARELE